MGAGASKSAVDRLLALRKSIRSGRFAPVYLFHLREGERDRETTGFLISTMVSALLSRFRDEPGAKLNVDFFEGPETGIGKVLMTANNPPMFGRSRLTVYRSSSPLKDDEGARRLLEYVKNPCPSTTLVLALATSKMPGAVLKAAGKLGCAHRIERVTERSLPKWITGVFGEEGVKITPGAVRTLADFAGTDLQAIEDAREKLLLYTMGKAAIEAGDVEELLLCSRSTDIYQLADALWRRNAAGAMSVLMQLEAQKTDPIFINTILVQQLRGLVKAKSITTRGRTSVSELASLLGVRDFVARKHAAAVRNFTMRELEEALSACIEMNALLKSHRMNPYRIIERGAMRVLSLHVQ